MRSESPWQDGSVKTFLKDMSNNRQESFRDEFKQYEQQLSGGEFVTVPAIGVDLVVSGKLPAGK